MIWSRSVLSDKVYSKVKHLLEKNGNSNISKLYNMNKF
jgi:hypothetical protein